MNQTSIYLQKTDVTTADILQLSTKFCLLDENNAQQSSSEIFTVTKVTENMNPNKVPGMNFTFTHFFKLVSLPDLHKLADSNRSVEN